MEKWENQGTQERWEDPKKSLYGYWIEFSVRACSMEDDTGGHSYHHSGPSIMARQKVLKRSLFTEFREPWQRGLAVAIGLSLGFIPKFGVLFASLALAAFLTPISLSLCFIVTAITSLLSPQLAGIKGNLGNFALSHPQLQTFWEWAYQQDLVKATGFSNDNTMGSILLAILCFYPSYFLTTLYYQRKRSFNEEHFQALDAFNSLPLSLEKTREAEKNSAGYRPAEDFSSSAGSSLHSTGPTLSSHQVDSCIHQSDISEAETLLASELKTVADDVARSAQTASPCGKSDATASSANSSRQQTTSTTNASERRESQDNPQLTPSIVTARQYEEQQWVLDTLIEIIRLREETELASGRSSSPPTETTRQNPTTLTNHNFIAPLVGTINQANPRSESSLAESEGTIKDNSEASNLLNQSIINTSSNPVPETEATMEKLIRTDSDAQKRILTTIVTSDRVENLSNTTPSPMNVVPHGSRPRSMHSRDESLRFLIHHLQCLQRERGE